MLRLQVHARSFFGMPVLMFFIWMFFIWGAQIAILHSANAADCCKTDFTRQAMDESFATYQKARSFSTLLDLARPRLAKRFYEFLDNKTREFDVWPKLRRQGVNEFIIEQDDVKVVLRLQNLENGEYEINGEKISIPSDESPGLTWNHILATIVATTDRRQQADLRTSWFMSKAFAAKAASSAMHVAAEQAVAGLTMTLIGDQNGTGTCDTIAANASICAQSRKANEVRKAPAYPSNQELDKIKDKDLLPADVTDPTTGMSAQDLTNGVTPRDYLTWQYQTRMKILQNYLSRDVAKNCPDYKAIVDCMNKNLQDAHDELGLSGKAPKADVQSSQGPVH